MRFGIQLYPPKTALQMASYAKKATAQHAFDKVWVPDHLTYENVFVILAAIIANTSAHVGSSVVNPFIRSPVDLASSFAALAHLAGRRGITVGIGAGSSSSDMIYKRNRVGMTREMVLFLREMFAGRKATMGDFPALADFFRLDPKAEGYLRLPPEQAPDIFIAAAGPKMLKMAAEIGDGLIVSNLSFPTALVQRGALDVAMNQIAAAQATRSPSHRFTKVLHLHVAVSRNGDAARKFAKRMAAGALIQGHLLKQRMVQLPIPDATVNAVQDGHRQGKNVDDMLDLINDDLLAEVGTVIAGTPEECLAQLDVMLRAARPYGFDIIDMASPLGPDWDEAIDLICQEIIPQLERNSSMYV